MPGRKRVVFKILRVVKKSSFDLGRGRITPMRRTLNEFFDLINTNGVAYAVRLAKEKKYRNILVNLSGRGDKDVEYVLGLKRNMATSK